MFLFWGTIPQSLDWPLVCYVVEDGLPILQCAGIGLYRSGGSILEFYTHVSTLPGFFPRPGMRTRNPSLRRHRCEEAEERDIVSMAIASPHPLQETANA